MGDQHNQERIPNPKGNEVEVLREEEEGESLSMRFLALAVSHTVPSSNRQRHSEVNATIFCYYLAQFLDV